MQETTGTYVTNRYILHLLRYYIRCVNIKYVSYTSRAL